MQEVSRKSSKSPVNLKQQNKSKTKKRHKLDEPAENKEEQEVSLNVADEQKVQEPEESENDIFYPHRPIKRKSYQKKKGDRSDVSFHFESSRIEDTQSRVVEIQSSNRGRTSNSIAEQKLSTNIRNSHYVYLDIFRKKHFLYVLVIVSMIGLCFLFLKNYENPQTNIKSMKEKFPEQDPHFWNAIVSGIKSTVVGQHPSTYIFLYRNESEEVMKKLLVEISKYAIFVLTNSYLHFAIDFKEEILKSAKFSNVSDYGSLISHLKEKLKENSLMIIENFEQVPEKYALAFHTFCDQYSPLVKKSAFFFTMKVDEFKNSPLDDVKDVENILRKNWPNIEDDTFNPLFIRVSNMILRVHPNNLHANERSS